MNGNKISELGYSQAVPRFFFLVRDQKMIKVYIILYWIEDIWINSSNESDT